MQSEQPNVAGDYAILEKMRTLESGVYLPDFVDRLRDIWNERGYNYFELPLEESELFALYEPGDYQRAAEMASNEFREKGVKE